MWGSTGENSLVLSNLMNSLTLITKMLRMPDCECIVTACDHMTVMWPCLCRKCAVAALKDVQKYLLVDGGQVAVSSCMYMYYTLLWCYTSIDLLICAVMYLYNFVTQNVPLNKVCITIHCVTCHVITQVFDATNSTVERRKLIIDHCCPHSIQVCWYYSVVWMQ